MFDFASYIDLPLVWFGLISTAVFLYVLLDGFDLGCGILFPFAPSDKCRNKIMNSIAPFWDGNETWLVLGGGGLFAAFPLAYSIIMPALYLPIILMLLGLIFRGVAFEFRFKSHSEKEQKIWDTAFHGGSLLAALMQGIVLGNIIQGIEVTERSFSGGPLDWANGFAFFTGISLVFGYALIGAAWMVMKTNGQTQVWARKTGRYVLVFVLLALIIVSVSMPFIDERIWNIWFTTPNIYYLFPLPLTTMFLIYLLRKDFGTDREIRPFLLSITIFLLGFIGLGISLFPWLVPFEFTIWEAAAASTSQSLLLVGTVIFLPIILTYTAYSYYIFRGKSGDKPMY